MIMSVVRMSWSNVRQDRIVLLLGYLLPLAFFSIYAGIAVLSRNSPPPGPAAARLGRDCATSKRASSSRATSMPAPVSR